MQITNSSQTEKSSSSVITSLISLRSYCREYNWPTLGQWHHWIYSNNPVAKQCVKKIGHRYLIDLPAFERYIAQASLEDPHNSQ